MFRDLEDSGNSLSLLWFSLASRGFNGPIHGQNPLRQYVGCRVVMGCPFFFCPSHGVCWPAWGLFGPRWRARAAPCRPKLKIGHILAWMDWIAIRSRLVPVRTPTLGGLHSSEWPRGTAGRGFGPPDACLAAFWGVLGRAAPPEMGPRSVKIPFFESDPGPLGGACRCILSPF